MHAHPISSNQLNNRTPPLHLTDAHVLQSSLSEQNCDNFAHELLQASYEGAQHTQRIPAAPAHEQAHDNEITAHNRIIAPLSFSAPVSETHAVLETENKDPNTTHQTASPPLHTPSKQRKYQVLHSISDCYASPETIDFDKINRMLLSIPERHIVKGKNLFRNAWKSMFKYYLLDHYKSVPNEKTLMATALKELETQTRIKNTDHLYCFVSGIALPLLKSQESFKTYLAHQQVRPEKTLDTEQIVELKHNLDQIITLCDGSREFIKLFFSMLPDKAKEKLFKKLSDNDQQLLVNLSPEKPERLLAFNQSMQRIGAVSAGPSQQHRASTVNREMHDEIKRKLKF